MIVPSNRSDSNSCRGHGGNVERRRGFARAGRRDRPLYSRMVSICLFSDMMHSREPYSLPKRVKSLAIRQYTLSAGDFDYSSGPYLGDGGRAISSTVQDARRAQARSCQHGGLAAPPT